METDKKQSNRTIFSNTVAKDFRIQSRPNKPLTVDTGDAFESKKLSTQGSVKNGQMQLFSPSSFKFKKNINLLSTPKLSALAKVNPENKFERIFMSLDKASAGLEEEENDEQIIKKLNDSFEMEIEDQKKLDLVGENAIRTFYNYYKKLDKIKDKNKFSLTNGTYRSFY